MADKLEPILFSVWPTKATILLLSTPDRSKSHPSVVVEPPPILKKGGDWGTGIEKIVVSL